MADNRWAYLGDFIESVSRRAFSRGAREEMSSDELAEQAMARPPLERVTAAARTLMGPGGDAARVAVAEQGLAAYAELDEEGRRAFFRVLRDEFGVDDEAVHRAYADWAADPGPRQVTDLVTVVEPARQELLRRLNLGPGATPRLVEMRADLLKALKDDPSLLAVDRDFAHLFASWFNRGFLRMERMNWSSSAATLEKITSYETVHPMRGWKDLRRRVEAMDRRVEAFFHPATGDEPLIFVEVALTTSVPSTITEILTAPVPNEPVNATTAVFYSINNTQAGLKGVSFGNFLIKQVVADLAAELPGLTTFVTLSPAPTFARWLADNDDPRDTELHERLTRTDWIEDEASIAELRPLVEAAAARYFVLAKDARGRPVDPVARFHLGNGAAAWQIDWPADLSEGALRRAHGLMINYRYEPAEIESNHEAFVRDGTVAHGEQVAEALRR